MFYVQSQDNSDGNYGREKDTSSDNTGDFVFPFALDIILTCQAKRSNPLKRVRAKTVSQSTS